RRFAVALVSAACPKVLFPPDGDHAAVTSAGPSSANGGSDRRSFWQPGLAQAIRQPRKVLISPSRLPVLEIGDPQRGLELSQTRHRLLRLGELAGERSACRNDT